MYSISLNYSLHKFMHLIHQIFFHAFYPFNISKAECFEQKVPSAQALRYTLLQKFIGTNF